MVLSTPSGQFAVLTKRGYGLDGDDGIFGKVATIEFQVFRLIDSVKASDCPGVLTASLLLAVQADGRTDAIVLDVMVPRFEFLGGVPIDGDKILLWDHRETS